MHVAQLTPRGSGCSIVIGNLPMQNEMAPGSLRGTSSSSPTHQAAREELCRRGVECSEIQVFDERDGGTLFGFADPDGNTWAVQQLKVRAEKAAHRSYPRSRPREPGFDERTWHASVADPTDSGRSSQDPREKPSSREDRACRLEPRATAQTFIATYLVSRYSSMPSLPPSRPMPDCLTPPKGAPALETRPWLRPTMPDSSFSQTRKARSRSRVKT